MSGEPGRDWEVRAITGMWLDRLADVGKHWVIHRIGGFYGEK